MTRPSDISTKAIACRVPIKDYIKFLTEASNKGMSISDWLLMKVYSTKPPKDEQKASKSVLAAKEKEIDRLQKQILQLSAERKEIADQYEIFRFKLEGLQKSMAQENMTVEQIRSYIEHIMQ